MAHGRDTLLYCSYDNVVDVFGPTFTYQILIGKHNNEQQSVIIYFSSSILIKF